MPDVWAKIKDLARTVIRKIFRGGLDIARRGDRHLQVPARGAEGPGRPRRERLQEGRHRDRRDRREARPVPQEPAQGARGRLQGLLGQRPEVPRAGRRRLDRRPAPDRRARADPVHDRQRLPLRRRRARDLDGARLEDRPARRAAALRAGCAPRRSALSTAWEWLSIAVTEGVEGLWRKFTEKINELKDTVVSMVAGFLFARDRREGRDQAPEHARPVGHHGRRQLDPARLRHDPQRDRVHGADPRDHRRLPHVGARGRGRRDRRRRAEDREGPRRGRAGRDRLPRQHPAPRQARRRRSARRSASSRPGWRRASSR